MPKFKYPKEWANILNREPSRMRCPGCGKKFSPATLCWFIYNEQAGKHDPPTCRKCHKLRLAGKPTIQPADPQTRLALD